MTDIHTDLLHEEPKDEVREIEPLISWTFDKYDRHERSTLWYVLAGLVVGGLLVYSIATSNILFGVIIFLTVVIIFGRHLKNADHVTCEIMEDGILVDGKAYPYHDINYFSIVSTTHGERILYIHEARGLRSSVPIPLNGADEIAIRDYLETVIEEDLEHIREPLWDSLMRKLKL